MDREKGALMDEIEKTLWSLTEVHLQYLCQQHGRDVSGVRGMDHRSLRRKLMEEMWDNTDSMKSEEQGMSWLLQLKKEIRRILEDGSVKPLSPCQSNKDQGRAEARDADNEWKEEGGVELPSTRPEAEPVSPSQSEGETTDCDMEDSDWLPSNGLGATLKSPSQSNDTGDTAEDEEWDREVRDWMASDQVEAEFSPNRDTPGQRDGCPMPPAAQQKTLGCGCSESASLHGLRGVSVQLTDCRKTLGLETHKTTHSCSRCWKRFATGDILERHLLNHTEGKQNNILSASHKRQFRPKHKPPQQAKESRRE
ncbi:hypothetical protein DPEC_G00169260 [Dallia pectoralis]|uniref:Uncharacterized protein n=1 Tax=Dallia pectoralis TaxID=75939 RepID=A0ACC2GCL0_DALPE|nr:hypothetical protein DPEC_G00169260 [Dallia pectoralis]